MIAIVDSTGARRDAISAEISMPIRGNWVAHVEMGTDTPPAPGPCTIEIERDGEPGTVDQFVGTVRYGSAWQGRSGFVVVGGAGGLRDAVVPRHYAVKSRAVPASQVVSDVLDVAGEELSDEAQLDGLELGQWTRAELTPAVTLSLVAELFGLGWRVLADGTIWIGEETWQTAQPVDYAFEGAQDPDARTIEVRPNRATLAPGQTVLGQQIVRVTYQVTGAGLRATLLYGETDRDELAAVVQSLVPPEVYSGTYGATVVTQHADDTLDVTVDDRRLPELRRIAFRPGIVGARVLFSQGARLRVAFEGNSPAGAYAFAPDADTTAAKGVARVGDTVDLGELQVEMVEGVPQFIWTAPAALGGASTGPAVFVRMTGAITSGSAEVLLR